ncbi:MAG: hypothetical protein K2Q23_20145 [Bryobacteraceae bacterium]|nr:hypothetical protein [Bryobacteraceae bacterium]
MSRHGGGNFGSETRQYNAYGQLTQLSVGGFTEVSKYSLTQNDGRVRSIARSGEKVVYQCDALQRLVRAETAGREDGGCLGRCR